MTLLSFDDDIEAAWRRFRIDLGDRIAVLEQGDELRFGPFDDDVEMHAAMTLSVTAARRFRCRLRCSTHHELSRREMLDDAGWRELRNGDLIVETGRRNVDRLAALSVRALRDVYDVVHPTLLAQGSAIQAVSAPTEPLIEFAVSPQDEDELHRLAIDALAAMTGTVVDVDDEGRIPLPTHPVTSWLRTLPDVAAMECYAVLCKGITDPGQAALFLATGADQWPGVSLHLAKGQVHASLRIECSVFHPANLATALAMWFAFVRDHALSIEIACGPSAPLTNRLAIGASLPPGLTGVLDLLHDRATADPAGVAAMAGHDAPMLVRYLRVCARNAQRCKMSEADALRRGDTRDAARFEDERQQWWHVIRALGAALRFVLDRRRQMQAQAERRKRPA
ncbi:hypothetical protein AAFP30_06240 [Gordonia sp. CPCC 205515]|uniref:TY-Chap domain-containing protein n=1 Tax=Gordonia sp. CPCC 205515 TaxID=3140791 RepID=UPI003AF37C2B